MNAARSHWSFLGDGCNSTDETVGPTEGFGEWGDVRERLEYTRQLNANLAAHHTERRRQQVDDHAQPAASTANIEPSPPGPTPIQSDPVRAQRALAAQAAIDAGGLREEWIDQDGNLMQGPPGSADA